MYGSIAFDAWAGSPFHSSDERPNQRLRTISSMSSVRTSSKSTEPSRLSSCRSLPFEQDRRVETQQHVGVG